MLRITAGIAFLSTAALAILLFARIQSFTLTGTADGATDGSLVLFTPNDPKLRDILVKGPPLMSQVIFYGNPSRGDVLLGFGAAAGFEEIPEGAFVEVSHHWVGFRPLKWALGSTEVRCAGRTYPYVCSKPAFLCILGAVTAAPVVLWSVVALPWLMVRRKKPS